MPPIPYTIHKRKPGFSQPQPQPCPTCYAPLTLVKGVLACAKHGPPTRP